jgi:hypothetical protein
VAPPGSEITAQTDADTVTVTVRAEIKILGGSFSRITVRSTAVAAREPEPIGAAP